MNKMLEYRLSAGMIAKQLVSMLRLSESSITMYETGKREPSPDTLMKIADILETTVDALLGRKNDPEENKKPAAGSHELTETERKLIHLLGQIKEDRKREYIIIQHLQIHLKIQCGGLQVRFRTPAGTARAPYL